MSNFKPHCNDHHTHPGCEYADDELELLKAMERFKRENGVRFPTFTDVLRVAKALGYRKGAADAGEGEGGRGREPDPAAPEPPG